ncbi:choice-of-anchor H family protein [Shewanella sp. MMG014]|uniref:choice-of-anchor H family protein n=1 Tax=Shewanella sp. MMG014 TaxID=2822691 RepID=UPI001FFDCF63|nr:choice-of-anchor H family protein [Shewanella sp. MMG014]
MNRQYPCLRRIRLFAISSISRFLMLVMGVASMSAMASTSQQSIIVSEGRQLSSIEQGYPLKAQHGVLTEQQKSSLNELVLKEKQQRQAGESAGKNHAEKLSRSEVITLRASGVMSAKVQRGLPTAQSLSNGTGLSKIQKTQVNQQAIVGYRDFDIYAAYSRLFDDLDEDGFYQTFSVTFDADVYGFTQGEAANVYAELYLSRNGGPWEHYYSTDVFTIYGDATDDDYEVLTTLAQGYKTDYYDVLIDLYELGYEDIVATLSSEESDGLYALPLESSDRDTVYEEEYVEVIETEVHVSGGSMAWTSLLILLLLGVQRTVLATKRLNNNTD